MFFVNIFLLIIILYQGVNNVFKNRCCTVMKQDCNKMII
ncbi:unnamed protein product [Spirodela intermedia]|uniref:Uncharacterized protein n=1 Tax=Spirodela intermedia TaxID=51605 RepID=A0A7I8J2R0_SPIIN|nr:unnamed protein product [Spirodela intermedia]CAA6664103.1 unnamed protein product [Spirodela intermedia]